MITATHIINAEYVCTMHYRGWSVLCTITIRTDLRHYPTREHRIDRVKVTSPKFDGTNEFTDNDKSTVKSLLRQLNVCYCGRCFGYTPHQPLPNNNHGRCIVCHYCPEQTSVSQSHRAPVPHAT